MIALRRIVRIGERVIVGNLSQRIKALLVQPAHHAGVITAIGGIGRRCPDTVLIVGAYKAAKIDGFFLSGVYFQQLTVTAVQRSSAVQMAFRQKILTIAQCVYLPGGVMPRVGHIVQLRARAYKCTQAQDCCAEQPQTDSLAGGGRSGSTPQAQQTAQIQCAGPQGQCAVQQLKQEQKSAQNTAEKQTPTLCGVLNDFSQKNSSQDRDAHQALSSSSRGKQGDAALMQPVPVSDEAIEAQQQTLPDAAEAEKQKQDETGEQPGTPQQPAAAAH